MATPDEKKEFLEQDLRDALKWLFVGAITWAASQSKPHRCGNQDALGMFTSLTQARALYEFFYSENRMPDDARAIDFAPSWAEPKSTLYLNYMQNKKPANKRIFHLVYCRSTAANAGGPGDDDPTHLKNQAINFAKDLRRLTEEFIRCVEPQFRGLAEGALDEALSEAGKTADYYSIPDTL
jgi:hypothetical protein